jgi:tricorn protease
LTVADAADGTGSRQVLVQPLGSEVRLRNLEWIEGNRQMVDDLSDGRVGYVYVPNTGIDGQTELVRQFTAQRNKEALLIDERFNTGGQIPDRFIELLNRPTLAWASTRNATGIPMPFVTHTGPKAMLMNGWSGSGGDAFPWFFREAGLGPLIGTRTWGGLIGFGPIPQIVDGGLVSAPGFRLYRNDGVWFAEGHGVDPDIEVLEDVTALAQGRDPQIERGVEELLKALRDDRIVAPQTPAPENRSRNGGGR